MQCLLTQASTWLATLCCLQRRRDGQSQFQVSQLVALPGASLREGTQLPESLWFAVKIHHSSCNANTGIMRLGLDLGNPSRPILSHTQVLLCHICYEERLQKQPLKKIGRAGGLQPLCSWRQGSSPDSPCIFSKGAFECQAVGSKVLSMHQRFCSLGSRGIKGVERISWRNLQLFQLAQSSEELWSTCKNKKEDPGYNFSLVMPATGLVNLYPKRKVLS